MPSVSRSGLKWTQLLILYVIRNLICHIKCNIIFYKVSGVFGNLIKLTRIYRPINPNVLCFKTSCKSCLSTFKTGKHQFTQFGNESTTKANSLFGLLNNTSPPVDLEHPTNQSQLRISSRKRSIKGYWEPCLE